MVAVALDVDGQPAGRGEAPRQVGDRRLARAAAQGELGVGAEDAADADAEGAADQLVALPHLDAVRVAEFVQHAQAPQQVVGEPLFGASGAAPADHPLEAQVRRRGPVGRVAQLSAQAALEAGLADGDDGPRVGEHQAMEKGSSPGSVFTTPASTSASYSSSLTIRCSAVAAGNGYRPRR